MVSLSALPLPPLLEQPVMARPKVMAAKTAAKIRLIFMFDSLPL